MTSSTAATAPPTPRNAASIVPGDISVSASTWTNPAAGADAIQGLRVGCGVAQRDLVRRAQRRLDPDQCRETFGFQRVFDRFQALGAFGMARRHGVAEAGRMGEEQRRHEPLSTRPSWLLGHAWPVCHAEQASERWKRNRIARWLFEA